MQKRVHNFDTDITPYPFADIEQDEDELAENEVVIEDNIDE